MDMRCDPMRALSIFLPQLYALCAEHGEDARITFGVIHAEPASNNTVPGKLSMTMDLRHPDKAAYASFLETAHRIINQVCAAEGAPVEIREFFHAPGVVFDPACVSAVEDAARALGFEAQRMVSGAGHDACNVARRAPTGMIFIPCEGGVSHNEAESIEPAHASAGADVLLHAVMKSAHIVGDAS